jgi:hypothetical protein
LRRWAKLTLTRSSTSFVSRRVNPRTVAHVSELQPADDCCPQFGIELDDVTTEKQIIRKEHHKDDEGVGEDEEARVLSCDC